MKLYARKQSFPGVSGQKKRRGGQYKKKNPHKVEGDPPPSIPNTHPSQIQVPEVTAITD